MGINHLKSSRLKTHKITRVLKNPVNIQYLLVKKANKIIILYVKSLIILQLLRISQLYGQLWDILYLDLITVCYNPQSLEDQSF